MKRVNMDRRKRYIKENNRRPDLQDGFANFIWNLRADQNRKFSKVLNGEISE